MHVFLFSGFLHRFPSYWTLKKISLVFRHSYSRILTILNVRLNKLKCSKLVEFRSWKSVGTLLQSRDLMAFIHYGVSSVTCRWSEAILTKTPGTVFWYFILALRSTKNCSYSVMNAVRFWLCQIRARGCFCSECISGPFLRGKRLLSVVGADISRRSVVSASVNRKWSWKNSAFSWRTNGAITLLTSYFPSDDAWVSVQIQIILRLNLIWHCWPHPSSQLSPVWTEQAIPS